MLGAIGVTSLDELLRVPDAVAFKRALDVPAGLAETELARAISSYAARNPAATDYVSFLGAGAYRHYCPPVVMALAMRGEFLTAYTPYQAEVSQGYLQAIYEWQTYICLLTGLDVANASVYDGATALAEAAIMAVNPTGRRAILVSSAVHPNYREVLRTYARGLELDVDELPAAADGTTDFASLEARLADKRYAAVAIQSPNFFGCIDVPPAKARAAFEATGTVPIAVVAEAQSFGNPLNFGGPYVGFIACTNEHVRRIPGRLVGRSVDNAGKTAYVLTLQAREQHIRREKATSNICTNQAHCALVATIYLAALGEKGLRRAAALNLERINRLAERVCAIEGFARVFAAPVFNEVVVRVPAGLTTERVLAALRERKILGGLEIGCWYPDLRDCILMTATETTTDAEIDALAAALGEIANETGLVASRHGGTRR
jgi:glycine dehydrogenase subunit 1